MVWGLRTTDMRSSGEAGVEGKDLGRTCRARTAPVVLSAPGAATMICAYIRDCTRPC